MKRYAVVFTPEAQAQLTELKISRESPLNRPVTGKERKSFRLNMLLEPNEVEVLDDFRYSARIPSRSEAIRVLIKLGIEAFATKAAKEGSTPSDAPGA